MEFTSSANCGSARRQRGRRRHAAHLAAWPKLRKPRPGALTFLANAKYEPFLYDTKASAVIVGRTLELRQAVAPALIRVDDPYSGFSQLLEFYAQATRTGKRGVEQPSYLAESSEIGARPLPGGVFLHRRELPLGRQCADFPPRLHRRPGQHRRGQHHPRRGQDLRRHRHWPFCVVKAGAVVGTDGFGFAPQPDGSYKAIPQIGNVVLEDYVSIGANATIDCATLGSTIIRQGSKIDNLVQLAHNVEMGRTPLSRPQSGIVGLHQNRRPLRAGRAGGHGRPRHAGQPHHRHGPVGRGQKREAGRH